jgi:hypothetical protein
VRVQNGAEADSPSSVAPAMLPWSTSQIPVAPALTWWWCMSGKWRLPRRESTGQSPRNIPVPKATEAASTASCSNIHTQLLTTEQCRARY